MNYLVGEFTRVNVPMLWVTARCLNLVQQATSSELTAALCPEAVVSRETGQVRATLRVGAHIGLFEGADPWKLSSRLVPMDLQTPNRFRARVRDAVLRTAVEEAINSDAAVSEVALGLAWLTRLDPSRPLPWSGPQAESTILQHRMAGVISNATQWNAFRRWAIELGIASSHQPRATLQALCPDPTVAVADTVVDFDKQMTATEFVAALQRNLPVIDGSALDALLSKRGVPRTRSDDLTLGPSVGLALRRLDHRRMLRLVKAADASHRVSYQIGRATDTFDEVQIGPQ